MQEFFSQFLYRFDVRGLLEFPIDFKRATEKREGNPLDEAAMLDEIRFGALHAEIDHGTSTQQKTYLSSNKKILNTFKNIFFKIFIQGLGS